MHTALVRKPRGNREGDGEDSIKCWLRRLGCEGPGE
jgi:hypothetical protein